MPQKVCPRCGSLFASLKSLTCPQCFARLETLDDDTAAELSAVRSRIESSREYQEQKEREDEKFRHESFQACLVTIGLAIAVLVFSVVIIVIAVKRQHSATATRLFVPPATATLDILTPRPGENATLEDVMPNNVGQYRILARDQQTTLSGTLTQVYHGRYVSGGAELDAYAVPGSRPSAELDRFRDAMTLIAGLASDKPRPMIQFRTAHWHYAVIGQSTATSAPALSLAQPAPELVQFRNSLGDKFSTQ